MRDEDLGITCLGCDRPMKVVARGELDFEAACPECGGRVGLSFSGAAATELVAIGQAELCRRFNTNRAIEQGKVVRLGDNR